MKQTYKYISTEIIEFFHLPLCQFITFDIDDMIYRYDFINSDETNDFMEKICGKNNIEEIAGTTIYIKCNMGTDAFDSFANYENTDEEMFIHQKWLTNRESDKGQVTAVDSPNCKCSRGVFDEIIQNRIHNDPVNHPSHYTQGGIECIDYLRAKLTDVEFMGFLRGNVIKYLSRAERKNGVEDYKKARWYLDKLIKLHEDFKKGA